MKIIKSGYIFEYLADTNEILLCNTNGRRYVKMPAWVKFSTDGKDVDFHAHTYSYADNCLTITAAASSNVVREASLSFILNDNTIEVGFTAEAIQNIHVDATELFRNGRKGLYMVDCIRYFSPAPRNYDGINRAFNKVLCDCTMDAYFAPPPLNFCIGNKSGWLAFGLLDLPDSYEFKMTQQLGILVENRGGKLVTPAGSCYRAPRLLLSFPQSEWESLSLFRNELAARDLLPDTPPRTVPAWWRNPLVVTYGDQMMELQYNWYSDDDWDSPDFTTAWLEKWLTRAEEKLGFNDFTVVVDAFWQSPYSAEARPDPIRFADMRSFIDRCHEKGHRILLWSAPLIDLPDNGFKTLSERFGVLSDDRLTGGIVDGKFYIDFTADTIDDYFDELSRLFFSDDPDALNCDGLKMDFLAYLRNPAEDVHYQNPQNGLGIKEMYRFYDRFQKAATKIKPDVLLNGSGCDPRFEYVMAMNRLHDIQNVYEERELRAHVSALACPGLVIDSDGAIMLSDWVAETYISAVIYGTPSLYYVNRFHDGVALTKDNMLALGRLLQLSAKKTEGIPHFCAPGSWQLKQNETITAESFNGKSLFVYDGTQTLYIFSWESGTFTMPCYQYSFANLPENFSCCDGKLVGQVDGGTVYALQVQ